MLREIVLLNDIHLGVQRAAGTTPKSAIALRTWLQTQLRELMMAHLDKDIIFPGDIFDEFLVSMHDMLMFYHTCNEWLSKSDGQMALGAGNHDLAKDSSRMSTLQVVGEILAYEHPERVGLILEPTMLVPGVYMIPHVANQDLLNLAIEQVPEEATVVIFHANYHNGFAAVQDHSLNVSEEQALKLVGNDYRQLIFAHEHQARQALGGKVIMLGNQWPSSIADCLRNPHGRKFAHVITPAVVDGFESPDPVMTWDAAESFIDIAWDAINLDDACARTQFVRVSGHAKPEQAPDVIATIAKLRAKSEAFVISNAVQIEGVQDMDDLPASIELTKQFDVLGFLYEQLEPEQAEVVKKLINNQKEVA